MDKTRLAGIFVAQMVPLEGNGQIIEAELRRHIDWLIERGVHGLFMNGSTGEFLRFTAEERIEIARMAVEQAAGRIPIVAVATAENARETIGMCEKYAEIGVDAGVLLPPLYYPMSDESQYRFFAHVADASPIDLLLYNIPAFSESIAVETIYRLIDGSPRIIGWKDSSGDTTMMCEILQYLQQTGSDFRCLTGWEGALLPMLALGCSGGVHASGGIIPEWLCAVYDAWQEGDIDRARRAQFQVVELFNAMLTAGDFPLGFRAAMGYRGFHFGPSRLTQSSHQGEELCMAMAPIGKLLTEMQVP